MSPKSDYDIADFLDSIQDMMDDIQSRMTNLTHFKIQIGKTYDATRKAENERKKDKKKSSSSIRLLIFT